MTHPIRRKQIDENYDAFQRMLSSIIVDHRHEYALLHDRELIAFFDSPGAAYRSGLTRFPDAVFSVQEVTDEPIDLGVFSHVRGG
jgi:hypothetical protein